MPANTNQVSNASSSNPVVDISAQPRGSIGRVLLAEDDEELRWLLEELRVSFFAQELKTPQPVSVKRLDKAWAQLGS